MRAMSEGVRWVCDTGYETLVVNHSGYPSVLKVVLEGDAAVDHRYPDTSTVVSVGPYQVRIHRSCGDINGALRLAVGGDIGNVRVGGNLLDCLNRQDDVNAVDDAVDLLDLPIRPELLEFVLSRRRLVLDDHVHRGIQIRLREVGGNFRAAKRHQRRAEQNEY